MLHTGRFCNWAKTASLVLIVMGSASAVTATPSKKRIVTFGDFEKSHLYKELNFSRIKSVPGYRIYQDSNNNYVVALQINKRGVITAERIMPIAKFPSKWQNGGLSFFMIDFVFGDKVALTDISASKELKPYLPKLSEGFKIRGFTVQQVQDPWKIRAGLDVRTAKARPWNLVFAAPKVQTETIDPTTAQTSATSTIEPTNGDSPTTIDPSTATEPATVQPEEPQSKPVEPYRKPSTWSIDGVPQYDHH